MNTVTISPYDSVLFAISALEKSLKTLVSVVDKDGVLLGVVSDGDIRRALIAHFDVNTSVSEIMNTSPFYFSQGLTRAEMRKILKKNRIEAAPILDDKHQVIDIFYIGDIEDGKERGGQRSQFGAAVIMAGGEGRRLRPLTDELPKPMLKVGGISIIERQVRSLAKHGIKNIFITINYCGDKISEYFKDGSSFGVSIKYVQEEKKLGTAGALSLISSNTFEGPILVINGDVITTIDFNSFGYFHFSNNAKLSIAAMKYIVDVPYGVVQNHNENVLGIVEKPSKQYLCNAGIYAIEKDLITSIPHNAFFNMTDLVQKVLSDKQKIVVFPMFEYWTDIGSKSELEKARQQFSLNIGDIHE